MKYIRKNSNWNKSALIASCQQLLNTFINQRVNIGEFGVYRAETIELMYHILNFGGLKPFVIGWDSFEGLPEETPNIDKFYVFQKGAFADSKQPQDTEHIKFIKTWFENLKIEQIQHFNIDKFALIHMDADLHKSTIEAYDFLLKNNLIGKGTIICYDEFKSASHLNCGEALAHNQISEKYKIEFEEFYRNEYRDQNDNTLLWQNAFIIKSIGSKSDIGLMNE